VSFLNIFGISLSNVGVFLDKDHVISPVTIDMEEAISHPFKGVARLFGDSLRGAIFRAHIDFDPMQR